MHTLLNKGSIFSCLFLLLILLASATLKNCGATSTSHFGSTAVTLWQYSLWNWLVKEAVLAEQRRHIPCCQDQFVIDQPFWITIEQSG